MITFQQATNLREILICSTLSERPVKIEFATQPGPYLQRTGCKIEVTTKGLTYIPGIITNKDAQLINFDCGPDRAISYYLEMVIVLSLFGKSDLNIQFEGITNDSTDCSVDTIINAYLPLVKQYNPEWTGTLKVTRRGFVTGTGSVLLSSKPVKYVRSIDLIERGPIKRIRGVCAGSKVAPNLLNRVVSQCRNVFNDYIPDVWIHTDLQKNLKGYTFENGYSVSLVAETTNGLLITSECEYSEQHDDPEKVGECGAMRLLDEIRNSGCVDTSLQQYALLFMALSEKRLSQIKLGRISTQTVETMRIIRTLLGVTFHINEQIFSCFGCGLQNLSREVQ